MPHQQRSSSSPAWTVQRSSDGGATSAAAGSETIEGRVKWFNAEKGFGFIVPDRGGRDVFVHAHAVERSGLSGLHEEQRVRATVRTGLKGPQAERIELLL